MQPNPNPANPENQPPRANRGRGRGGAHVPRAPRNRRNARPAPAPAQPQPDQPAPAQPELAQVAPAPIIVRGESPYQFRARTHLPTVDPDDRVTAEFLRGHGVRFREAPTRETTINQHGPGAAAREVLTVAVLRRAHEHGYRTLLDHYGSARTERLNARLNGTPDNRPEPEPLTVHVWGPQAQAEDIARAPRLPNAPAANCALMCDVYHGPGGLPFTPAHAATLLRTLAPAGDTPPALYIIAHTFRGVYGTYGTSRWLRTCPNGHHLIRFRPDAATPEYAPHPPMDWLLVNGCADGVAWATVKAIGSYSLTEVRLSALEHPARPVAAPSYWHELEVPDYAAADGALLAPLARLYLALGVHRAPTAVRTAIDSVLTLAGLRPPMLRALIPASLMAALRSNLAARSVNTYVLREVVHRAVEFFIKDPAAAAVAEAFPRAFDGLEYAVTCAALQEIATKDAPTLAAIADAYGSDLAEHNRQMRTFANGPAPPPHGAPLWLPMAAGVALFALGYWLKRKLVPAPTASGAFTDPRSWGPLPRLFTAARSRVEGLVAAARTLPPAGDIFARARSWLADATPTVAGLGTPSVTVTTPRNPARAFALYAIILAPLFEETTRPLRRWFFNLIGLPSWLSVLGYVWDDHHGDALARSYGASIPGDAWSVLGRALMRTLLHGTFHTVSLRYGVIPALALHMAWNAANFTAHTGLRPAAGHPLAWFLTCAFGLVALALWRRAARPPTSPPAATGALLGWFAAIAGRSTDPLPAAPEPGIHPLPGPLAVPRVVSPHPKPLPEQDPLVHVVGGREAFRPNLRDQRGVWYAYAIPAVPATMPAMSNENAQAMVYTRLTRMGPLGPIRAEVQAALARHPATLELVSRVAEAQFPPVDYDSSLGPWLDHLPQDKAAKYARALHDQGASTTRPRVTVIEVRPKVDEMHFKVSPVVRPIFNLDPHIQTAVGPFVYHATKRIAAVFSLQGLAPDFQEPDDRLDNAVTWHARVHAPPGESHHVLLPNGHRLVVLIAVGYSREALAANLTEWVLHATTEWLLVVHGDDTLLIERLPEHPYFVVHTSDYEQFDNSQTRYAGAITNDFLRAAGCPEPPLRTLTECYTARLKVITETEPVYIDRNPCGSFATGSAATTVNNSVVNAAATTATLWTNAALGDHPCADFRHMMLQVAGLSAKYQRREGLVGAEFLKCTLARAWLTTRDPAGAPNATVPVYAFLPSLAQFAKMGKSGRDPREIFVGDLPDAAWAFLRSQSQSLPVIRDPVTAPAYALWAAGPDLPQRASLPTRWWEGINPALPTDPFLNGQVGDVTVALDDACFAHAARYGIPADQIEQLHRQLSEYAQLGQPFAVLAHPVWETVVGVEYG